MGFCQGSITKKVGGKEYFVLSINTQRGKRFKQEKYYLKSEAAEVTAGNIDIHLNDKDALSKFHAELMSSK